ncbi:MAG: 3-hydroxyacyl-[acyl-carrier-protein] dehydratase FabZ [Chthoniobacterales bacterium]
MSEQSADSQPLRPWLGLPHRPPFVFVREILSQEPGQSAECLTWFDPEEPMFAGHFPDNPLVPGVILTEALAQAAGIAAASGFAENERPIFLLSAIRAMKFLRAVRPGERLRLRAEKLAKIDGLMQFKVDASILKDGERVAEGHLVLSTTSAFRYPENSN